MRGLLFLAIAETATALVISGCTRSDAIRTSADTVIVQTEAAPICGGTGAARTAYKQAAIETIKAGYDGFIIANGQAANNVGVTQLPGSYHTFGTVNGMGNFNATTTYNPGAMIAHGSHDQAFSVKMFKRGQPGFGSAISAKEVLGPEWKKIVSEGIHTC